MPEYIEREALDKKLTDAAVNDENKNCNTWSNAIGVLYNLPAADVAPVVHGRWIRPHWKNSNYCCDCSECGGEAMHRDYQWHKNGIYPICPNCGARMDGGGENG